MSDVELITFTDNSVTITVYIDDEANIKEMKDLWQNRVQSCQAPLLGGHKNGFSVFIPWILKTEVEESVDPEEPDEWAYSEPEEWDEWNYTQSGGS